MLNNTPNTGRAISIFSFVYNCNVLKKTVASAARLHSTLVPIDKRSIVSLLAAY